MKVVAIIMELAFSLLIGALTVWIVSLSLDLFFPSPTEMYTDDGMAPAYLQTMLTQGLVTLPIGIGLLLASVYVPPRLGVIDNGLLAGGAFTLVAALTSISAAGTGDLTSQLIRLGAAVLTLVLVLAVGWMKFARAPKVAPGGSTAQSAEEEGTLALRVAALEARLDRLRETL